MLQPTEFVLERNGCPLHYWLSGPPERPLIVLTHGAGIDHRMFDTQVAALAGKYRCLTWDVRGHGSSRPIGTNFSIRGAVDDLLAILDAQHVQQAIFLGQSMGGNIAQELVRLHPDRVTALVLVDCACNTSTLSPVERWAIRLTPMLLRMYPFATLLRQSAKAASIKPDVQRYLFETMGRLSKNDIVTILSETTACLRDDPNYRIPRPFLLMRGEHDSAGAIKKQAPLWATREPLCRYVVIPDAGHCANQDNPEYFNQVLREYLDEHSGLDIA